MLTEALAAYVLAAMGTFVPTTDHAYYESNEATQARYAEVAAAIATTVADAQPEALPYGDTDAGRVRAAIMLAAIGANETHYNAATVTCAKGGDKNKVTGVPRAWGTFQLHASKERVCSSLASQTTIALRFMVGSVHACRRFPDADRLAGFTDGFCREKWKRSRRVVERADRYLKKHAYVDVAPNDT